MKKLKISGHLGSLLAAIAVLFILAFPASAAVFVVNSILDANDATPGDTICADGTGACTLRAAITEANALAGADTITLPAGTYTIVTAASENTNATGDLDLNTEITINGAGSATTIVQAAATRGVAVERVFHLRASFPMALNDMTVRYGRYTTAAGTFGAGIRIDTAAVVATLTNVIVTENDDGTSGGGIAVSGTTAGASLTLNTCTVSNNTAGGTLAASANGAGVMGNVTTATININNSTITGNTGSNSSTTASPSGGGVSSIGTLNITNSFITNNSVTSTGFNAFSGGVHITSGTATITGSTISGNSSNVTAGAAANAALVGGLYNQQATVSIINSTVTGNTTSNTVTAANAFHVGVRTLSGAIAATTNITNSTISGNTTAGIEGGGVVNIATATANSTTNITGSTISGNMVTGAGGIAGGLENFNVAAITGLAVINVTNSTIAGNSAATAAGSYNSGSTSTINYNYATIAANTAATAGGGLYQGASGTTNLKNSIVADNTAPTGPDINGTITSQDYNHVEDVTGGTFLTGSNEKTTDTVFLALPNDVTGTDPLLGALQNNGGPTFTKMPSNSSPVVNAIPNGTSDCGTVITVDQRAITRPQSLGCDKGAVELALSAAGASIGGRVLTADGRGIRNAIVVITGGNLNEPRMVATGTFGYYEIDHLEVGHTYFVTVNSKRFVFTTPTVIVTLEDNIAELNFQAQPME